MIGHSEKGRGRKDESAATDATQTAAGAQLFDCAELPALARRVVETFVRDQLIIKIPHEAVASSLLQPAACFVSLKTTWGDLRGCIGTIEPTQPTLLDELITNAIGSATRDPRFPPVAPEELTHLRYSVDVLSAPEPTRFEELDVKTYGIIVEDETGSRRGLLLPDIEGVTTPEQQLEIAARKAGLRLEQTLKLYRFRVNRFAEKSEK